MTQRDTALGGVFINYRGMDSGSNGALLYRELTRQLDAGLVFLDSASIPAGADYVAEVLRRVQQARVVLAVIGPQWLTAADDRGRRLIDNPADWIRRELAEAFAAGVRVIPVLTDGARMPTTADLPDDIAALARCQYLWLRHRDAAADLARIVAACTEELGADTAGPCPSDQAGAPHAGPGQEASAGRGRGPRGHRGPASRVIVGFCAVAVVPVVVVIASPDNGSHPLQAPPTASPMTGPTPNSSAHTEPPASPPATEPRPVPSQHTDFAAASPTAPSSPQPTGTTQAQPQPTVSLPPQTPASLSEGMGIDFESGSVGLALTLSGVDISIGVGAVEGGDGTAIYVTAVKPTRPADCYGQPATSSVSLPLPAGHHLCVRTGGGQMATLDVTSSSLVTLRFSYRLWPQAT